MQHERVITTSRVMKIQLSSALRTIFRTFISINLLFYCVIVPRTRTAFFL